jgi:superkiller protein 3
LADQKQYEKAIEKYNQSIEINPDNDNPYLGLGYVYYKGYKQYKDAIETYQIVIERHPTNYLAYNDLALILADKGDIAAAQENYKKAIAANPEYAKAYYNLGLTFVEQEDYPHAIAQFKRITELPYHAENYFKAYNGLCYSLGKENKYQEAIANCELAIKIHPKDTNIYDTLGTVYLTQKDYPKALLHYQAAVNYSADNSEAQQHLAEVLAMMGKCEQARSHLTLALKLDKNVDKTGVGKYCKN